MLLTLGAAGATLLVFLVLVGAPAIGACNGDARGLIGCLRGLIDDRFDLGAEAEIAPAVEPAAPAAPIVAEKPVEQAPLPPTVVVAELPAEPPTPPVAPQTVPAEPDATPLPVAEPAVPPQAVPQPVEPAEAVIEPEATTAPETIGLAKVVEPLPEPLPEPAPSFVPPALATPLNGVPPDLQVAALTPEPAPPAPSFVPPPLAEPIEGVPPDLQADATEPAVLEPAPAFVPPLPPIRPATPPPDLTVAALDPAPPPVEPAPTLPVPLAPTIDAVEIDGDGSFIAGNGPEGALMRLYVDGVPVGVSPVEAGRWLVEGDGLLTEQRQALKVEALDPTTGKLLGEAEIAFERPVAPVAEPAQPEVEQSLVLPETPATLPPLEPVVPAAESNSVTILKPSGDETDTITTLPTTPSPGATLHLGAAPTEPAIIAEFTLPAPTATPSVSVLRAIPIGDPDAGRFISGKAIIRRGDTLWDIAHRYYGRGIRYDTIYRANRDLIGRPGRIYPGQVFDLPLVYDD